MAHPFHTIQVWVPRPLLRRRCAAKGGEKTSGAKAPNILGPLFAGLKTRTTSVPQGLKPAPLMARYGTAKAVPLPLTMGRDSRVAGLHYLSRPYRTLIALPPTRH